MPEQEEEELPAEVEFGELGDASLFAVLIQLVRVLVSCGVGFKEFYTRHYFKHKHAV